MKSIIWIVTAGIIAVWSLLCWAAHEIVGLGGGLAAGNTDIVPMLPPEMIELLSWLAVVGTNVGEWLIIAIWAIVSAAVALVGAIAARLLGRRGSQAAPVRSPD
jgi:hypothetical protein